MDLPTYQEWQDLPGKSARKEILISLRREFEDKDIRELWGMKPQTWYNLLSRYEIGGKRAQTPPEGDDTRPHRQDEPLTQQDRGKKICTVEGCEAPHVAKGFCQKHYLQQKNQRKQKPEPPQEPPQEEVRDSIPSDRRWPRTNVLEAEYTVVEETPSHERPAPSKPPEAPTGGLPFPTIKGTPSQLRKQFEGVALFLEGLENEGTRFEIRLTVVKA